MKKISLFLGAALMSLVVASCGSSKAVVETPAPAPQPAIQTLPEEPCSEFLSTQDVFRATGQHVAKGDRQIQFAYDQAGVAARADLAAQIETKVKAVNDRYVNSYTVNDANDFKERIENMTRAVINQELKFAPVVCKKRALGSEAGTIICYVAVEIPVENILNGITSSIASDERLRVDYEYEKYKKVFDEEMGKLQ